jgi:hypothetical protein
MFHKIVLSRNSGAAFVKGYKRTTCCDLRVNDGRTTFGIAEDAANERVRVALESSGDFLPPPPPNEKATARQDQPRQASTFIVIREHV